MQYLHDHTVEQGYGPHDFRIYAGTGSADIAYPNLTPQIEGIKQAADLFQFSDNLAEERERDAFIPHSVRIMRIHSVKMQGNGKNI